MRKEEAPRFPAYDGKKLTQESKGLISLAKETISLRDPEWEEETRLLGPADSWAEIEERNYGEHAFSFLSQEHLPTGRVRAIDFRWQEGAIRLEEAQLYHHDRDDHASDTIFKEPEVSRSIYRIHLALGSGEGLLLIPQQNDDLLVLAEHCHFVEVRGEGLTLYRKDLTQREIDAVPQAVLGIVQRVRALIQEGRSQGAIQNCFGDWREWSARMPEMTKELGYPTAAKQLEVLEKVAKS